VLGQVPHLREVLAIAAIVVGVAIHREPASETRLRQVSAQPT
jgi:hypothetical protein